MTINRKVTGKALSLPRGLLLGNGVSVAFTLLLSAVLAKLVSTERMQWEQIGYGIMALLFISSVTGTIVAVNTIKRQLLIVCASAGALYWISLLAITALFFGGQYHGVLATGATILAGCGTVCLLGLRRKAGKEGSPYRRKHKKLS